MKKDLTGQVFGKLTVIQKTGQKNKHGHPLWLCQCSCGNTTESICGELTSGNKVSCGCLWPKNRGEDITGKVFSRLTVIERTTEKSKFGSLLWLCKCECGNTVKVTHGALTQGNNRSCGCLRKENQLAVVSGPRLPKGEAASRAILRAYRHRAEQRGLTFELSAEHFFELTQQPCSYCGTELSNTHTEHTSYGIFRYNGIDRVDNSVGYVTGNVVPCCNICNLLKRDLSVGQFLAQIEKIRAFQEKKNLCSEKKKYLT